LCDDDAALPAHLSGPASRIAQAAQFTIPEIEHLIGPLEGKQILDFGCGTGSTVVALQSSGAQVWGYDVSSARAEVARMRLREHGMDPGRVHASAEVTQTALEPGAYDVVVLNAVIEHIPKSVPGLRAKVLRSALAMVAPGGHLVVSQSPNRLWPRDVYLSGQWLLPWTRPGSRYAYRRLVKAGAQRQHGDEAAGRRDLEERGLWGFTYWELLDCLGEGVSCVNLRPEFRNQTAFTHSVRPLRSRTESVLSRTLCRALGVPVMALSPFFWPLVFRKTDPDLVSNYPA
jgi:ubiquinone/menaquinone biosynthesis C-methylase UbiE